MLIKYYGVTNEFSFGKLSVVDVWSGYFYVVYRANLTAFYLILYPSADGV